MYSFPLEHFKLLNGRISCPREWTCVSVLINGLEGPYEVETQFPCIPICCDSLTFCLSSRPADHFAAGLNIIILSHLRAFESADPSTWILQICMWLLPLQTSFPQHSPLRPKSLLLILCLISLCVCFIHYSNKDYQGMWVIWRSPHTDPKLIRTRNMPVLLPKGRPALKQHQSRATRIAALNWLV